MMNLMGLSEEDRIMLNYIYWDATYTSIKNNIMQNYTYRVNPSIAATKAKVILCCGSKEPYAKKSHRILMKYLKNVREIILEGYGHGQMLYFQGNMLSKMIIKEWEANR